MKKHLTVLVFVCLLGAAHVAQGAMMGFTFSGTITQMYDVYDDSGAFNGIEVGSGFSGGLFYDPDVAPYYENATESWSVYSGISYWIDLGSLVVTPIGSIDLVVSDRGSLGDAFTMLDSVPEPSNPHVLFDDTAITFADSTGTAFDSTQLPSWLSLSSFDNVYIELYEAYYASSVPGSSTAAIHGTIDEVHFINGAASVPEPATFLLLGLGIAVLAAVFRKRVLNRV